MDDLVIAGKAEIWQVTEKESFFLAIIA